MELAEVFSAEYWIVISRLILNLVAVTVLGRWIYFTKGGGSHEFLFSFIAISTIIFIICSLLSNVEVQLGIALGLFAVFSIIRFRNIAAGPRQLSYLFVSLGLALMNALVPFETPFVRLLINNLMILAIMGVADYLLFRNQGVVKMINYDRLDLLEKSKRGEMEDDMKIRFGITQIMKIQIGNIDTVKGQAKVKVWIADQDHLHFED